MGIRIKIIVAHRVVVIVVRKNVFDDFRSFDAMIFRLFRLFWLFLLFRF